jgi:Disulphide bond corrector protein DsbC
VKVGKVQYPAGTKYAFDFAPNEKLSVYTGDFVVKVSVTAAHAGSYMLGALLDYQACDNLKCYPVKTLQITVMVTAK